MWRKVLALGTEQNNLLAGWRRGRFCGGNSKVWAHSDAGGISEGARFKRRERSNEVGMVRHALVLLLMVNLPRDRISCRVLVPF